MAGSIDLTPETLETIGNYVRRNLRFWLADAPAGEPTGDFELRERIIRVEEVLSSQRELMLQGFEETRRHFELQDKRFDQIDQRIRKQREESNNRFDDIHRHTSRWMTALLVMLGIIGMAMTITNLIS